MREEALIFSAARQAFLRRREELRRVGERFSGDLALILSASPLADLGMGRIAQGFIPSHDRRNARAETLITSPSARTLRATDLKHGKNGSYKIKIDSRSASDW